MIRKNRSINDPWTVSMWEEPLLIDTYLPVKIENHKDFKIIHYERKKVVLKAFFQRPKRPKTLSFLN